MQDMFSASKILAFASFYVWYQSLCDRSAFQAADLEWHKLFISGESEHTPKIILVEKLDRHANISDTDNGREILEQINDLQALFEVYKSGVIKEQ